MFMFFAGPAGCGKSAISAKVAMDSNFPFVKILSPENLVSNSESGKCYKITKVSKCLAQPYCHCFDSERTKMK
jgi:vesicle-fusing ATPase